MSEAAAPPLFVRARTCFVDREARGGSPASGSAKPFVKPAWSMSHAALVLTRPPPAGKRGAPAGRASASSALGAPAALLSLPGGGLRTGLLVCALVPALFAMGVARWED